MEQDKNIKASRASQVRTENTRESSELAAFCWQGYQRRSQNLGKSFLENKLKLEMKQLITIL
jgi:hypothetical protein